MRHRVGGFKLGRDAEHRRALRRNLAIAVLSHGQITTTVPRAKSVKPFVEKLITLARKGDLAARRRVIAALGDPIIVRNDSDADVKRNKYGELLSGPRLVKKLFAEIAPRYGDRPGGYTRIVRLGKHRIGDGGDLCVLQLVGNESGPQVAGQFSRRREKANRRMEFAAKARKAKADSAEAPKA
jgi:large subunit ribosomal protein L17